jgi:hypothetical protein
MASLPIRQPYTENGTVVSETNLKTKYTSADQTFFSDVPRFYGANIKMPDLSQRKRKKEQWGNRAIRRSSTRGLGLGGSE